MPFKKNKDIFIRRESVGTAQTTKRRGESRTQASQAIGDADVNDPTVGPSKRGKRDLKKSPALELGLVSNRIDGVLDADLNESMYKENEVDWLNMTVVAKNPKASSQPLGETREETGLDWKKTSSPASLESLDSLQILEDRLDNNISRSRSVIESLQAQLSGLEAEIQTLAKENSVLKRLHTAHSELTGLSITQESLGRMLCTYTGTAHTVNLEIERNGREFRIHCTDSPTPDKPLYLRQESFIDRADILNFFLLLCRYSNNQ